MKTKARSNSGLSLMEILLVLATVALLILVLLPMLLSRSGAVIRARRVSCVSNLKCIGLASRIYANDHEDSFSWMVSTNFNPNNTSGSLEFAGSWQVFRHFEAMSNELNTPKILVCPSDRQRTKANDFSRFSNTNLSYFAGPDADEGNPQSILSGDRNITGGTLSNGFLRVLTPGTAADWTADLHVNAGNIGLGDGSAQALDGARLRQQLTTITNATIRLVIP